MISDVHAFCERCKRGIDDACVEAIWVHRSGKLLCDGCHGAVAIEELRAPESLL